MANVSIARRYARALLEVADESSKIDSIGAQLSTIAASMEKNRELQDVLSDPAYTRAQRQSVLASLMTAAKLDEPALKNALFLMLERNRASHVPAMARAYEAMADLKGGRVRGRVISAKHMDPEGLKKVQLALERITRRKVLLESAVDPKLLGGMAARVGSVLFDGTLRTQLEGLERALKG